MAVRLLALVAFAAVVFNPTRVSASCIPFQERVLWSFPADGAIDVPTNADLWASGVAGPPRLNGEELTPNGFGGYDLGELAPNTRYEVTWTVASSLTVEEATKVLSTSFTTGLEALEATAAMLVSQNPPLIVRNPTITPPYCPLVVPDDCFDTPNQTTRVLFDPGPTSVAWLVERQLCDGSTTTTVWPVECGPPLIWSNDPILCTRLAKIDGAHVGLATDFLCSAPRLPMGITLPTRSSCLADWPPASATTVASSNGEAVPKAAAGTTEPSATKAAGAMLPRTSASGCSIARVAPPGRSVLGLLALASCAAVLSSRKRSR